MIYNSMLDLIGNTPIVKLKNVVPKGCANIYLKLEYFNPTGSHKDRIALMMIKNAEERGLIKPGDTIIEATSGNTGISVAFVGRLKGYKVILVVPDNISKDKILLAEALGAKVILGRHDVTPDHPEHPVNIAKRIAKEVNGLFLSQFENPANVEAHYYGTGREIWNQLYGMIDAFVMGIGTGGTIVGVAKYLKEKNKNIKIIAVIPYFGLARQDRKDKPRVSVASKLVANLLTAAGVQRIITIDLHADQIQGFFDVPVDHVYASSIFIDYIKTLNLPNLITASPDTGGTRRAAAYAKFLDTGFVICYKQRSKPNEIATMELVGDVEGKDVLIIDDIIDTAGSITKAGNLIMERGAASVRAFCTHPVFSGDAYKRIENSAFKEVVVTDTVPIKQECSKIKVLSTADLFAEVIKRALKTKSISSLYQIKNK